MTADWLNRVHFGDCREAMKSWPTGVADACITDPPYGDTSLDWDRRCSGWMAPAAQRHPCEQRPRPRRPPDAEAARPYRAADPVFRASGRHRHRALCRQQLDRSCGGAHRPPVGSVRNQPRVRSHAGGALGSTRTGIRMNSTTHGSGVAPTAAPSMIGVGTERIEPPQVTHGAPHLYGVLGTPETKENDRG